jgi:hypothetical protein
MSADGPHDDHVHRDDRRRVEGEPDAAGLLDSTHPTTNAGTCPPPDVTFARPVALSLVR